MASTSSAEPPAAIPVSSPAASSKLQGRGQSKKKPRRVTNQQHGSMCEVPYNVAAPVEQLSPSSHGVSSPQQPEAVVTAWQQRAKAVTSGSNSYEGGGCQHDGRCTCPSGSSSPVASRCKTAANGTSGEAGSQVSSCSSSGGKQGGSSSSSNSSRQQCHSNGTANSPDSRGSSSASGDDGEGSDAWRRRKLAAVKGSQNPLKQQDRQRQQDAAADLDSSQQHRGAAQGNDSGSPRRVNGFAKGYGPKQYSSSAQRQQLPQQLDVQLQLAGLPFNVEQQDWMSIQFGDLPPPHQLGTSPGSEDTLMHIGSSSGRQQTVVAMPGIHYSNSASCVAGTSNGASQAPKQRLQLQRSHSSGEHQPRVNGMLMTDELASALTAATSALQQSPNAAGVPKLQNGRTEHTVKHQGVVNGKHDGKAAAAVAAAANAAVQQAQHQQQSGNGVARPGQQSHSRPGSAPSTPQSKGGSKGPRSPQLSPQLLEQFGLRVAPLNGCMLPNELQLRAAIEQAGASAVLVARDDAGWQRAPDTPTGQKQPQPTSSTGDATDSKGNPQGANACSNVDAVEGTSSQQLRQQQRGPSPRVGTALPSPPAGSAGQSSTSKPQQLQLQVQVPDAGVDDCSVTSSGSSVQTSSTISNAWQQHESAVAALQLSNGHSGPGSSRAAQGQQHAGFGTLLGHQQHIYPGHNSSPQLHQHMDQSDIMSDPGTVPGGGFNGYSRMKPGRNRFVQHHHMGGPAGGPLYGNRQQHMHEQPLLMQQLAGAGGGGGNSGSSRRGGGGSNSRDHGGNDGSSHGSNNDRGGDRGADRGGRGGGTSRDGDGGSSGSGGRRGGDRGGRRNSKGNSLDYGMPRSPQMGAAGSRRSFDARGGYEDRRGGGRHTPLASPGGRNSREQQRGGFNDRNNSRSDLRDVSSPHMHNSNSSSNLVGHPSPLLLPEPALTSGPGSSRPVGMVPMDLPPSAASAGLPPSGPLTDLERFLAAAGPAVPVSPVMPLQQVLEGLTLKSVWDLFMEPSLWGTPVNTMGGPRGPSTAYYVPFMSAMQLFTTVADVSPPSPAPASNSGAGSSASSETGSTDSSSSGSPIPSSCSSISSSYAAAAAAGTSAAVNNPRSPSGPAVAAAAAAAAAAAGSAPVGPGGRGRLYTCAVKGWPTVMRLLLEHMEQELPFSRDPFYIQLEAMAGGAEAVEAAAAATAAAAAGADAASTSSGSSEAAAAPSFAAGGFTACGYPLVGPDLMSTRLIDIHPASWFAVAWYPVYRIPDAPLTARFLTFYSFSQLLEVLNDAVSAAKADLSAPCRLAGLPMPVVGMKWYNLMGERWLELLGTSAQAAAFGGVPSRRGRDNSRDNSNAQNGNADGEQQLLRLQMHPTRFREWQGRLQDLQGVAERLSKGSGLKVLTPQGPKEVRLYHSDYEFFNSRS